MGKDETSLRARLSRMRLAPHVRFLGAWAAAMRPGYPAVFTAPMARRLAMPWRLRSPSASAMLLALTPLSRTAPVGPT